MEGAHSSAADSDARGAWAEHACLWRSAGHTGRILIRGGSMRPTLADGDVVRVRAGPARFGELAVARNPEGGLVAHRVVGRRGADLLLRGDDAPATDPPVAADDVLGRVVAVEGLHGRRLDGAAARVVGVATAGYARAQHALGQRPRRPRPQALARAVAGATGHLLPAMAPEVAFLLLLTRPATSAAAAEQAARLAGEGLRWDHVAELARRGQLGPLLYRRLSQLPSGTHVPDEARADLQRQYVGNFLRCGEQARFTAEILGRLARAGIPVLAHKGLALALTVYDEPALRIAGDIDLSVPDDQLSQAEAAVADVRAGLLRANPDRRSQHGHHVELDGTEHHDLDPARHGGGRWATGPLDWSGIWERARTVTVAGQPVLVPGPADLVITLIANSLRRGFSPVRLVADLAATVDRLGAALDWRQVEAVLRDTRLDRRSWIALGLARDWFAADIPARLLEPPDDLHTAAWERLLLGHKHRQPLARLPTRVLWAGSSAAAARQAWRLWRAGPRP